MRLSAAVLAFPLFFLLQSIFASPVVAAIDPDPYESVNTSLLLVEGLDLDNGTRVTVWTTSDQQIGRGTVEAGRALVVVRGDDETTPDLVEGAHPSEAIYLKVHPSDEEPSYPLGIQAIDDVLTGAALSELRFQNDAVYKLTATSLPTTFELAENYPNPFTSSTTISYVVPKAAPVTIEVFNTLGQRVATLVDERKPPGEHTVTLNAAGLSSGVYIYRLRTGNQSITRKMLVVR